MEFEETIGWVTGLIYDNSPLTIAVFVGLVLLVFWKPKPMLKLFGAILILGAFFYLFAQFIDVTFTGVTHRDKMIEKRP